MHKYIIMLCLALLGAFSFVYADATKSATASQAWVENFVTNYVAQTQSQLVATATTTEKDGIVTINLGENEVKYEEPSDAALKVVQTSSSVTNGTLFVWNGANKYINPSGTIEATKTSLVYDGISSIASGNEITFPGAFTVTPVLIQPSVSHSTTNNMEVVK